MGTGDSRSSFNAAVAIAVSAVSASVGLASSNTPTNFKTVTYLLSAGSWDHGLPTVSQDAIFLSTSNTTATFTNSSSVPGSLTVGSIDDLHTGVTTTIQNDATTTAVGTLTFGGAGNLGNAASGASSGDLIYVAGTSGTTKLNLNSGATAALNFVLGQAGSFNTASAATLNIGTANVASTFNNAGYLLSVTGAGATNIGSTTAGVGTVITGSGGIAKAGIGTLTLNAINTYTGGTTVSGGTLSVVTLANGGLNSSIGASSGSADTLLLSGGGILSYTGAAASTDRQFTLNGVTAGDSGGIAANGTGAINFTNTGPIAYGTANQTRTLTLGGANADNNTLAAAIVNNGTAAVSVAKSGTGTWVLPAANSYTGGTALSGGTLAIGSDNSIGSGALTVSGTATLRSTDAAPRTLANVLNFSGSNVSFVIGGAGTGNVLFSNTSATKHDLGAAARTIGVINTATFAGGFTGTTNAGNGTSGAIFKDGPGTLILNGASTFPGGITINPDGGNLRLGNDTAAGSGLIKIQGTGAQTGTLQLAGGVSVGNTISIQNVRNDPSAGGMPYVENVSGNNALTAASMTIDSATTLVPFQSDAGQLTINAPLSGSTATNVYRTYHLYGDGNGVLAGVITNGASASSTLVNKNGTGVWTLSGSNTYNGQTTINGGTLVAAASRDVTGSTLNASATGKGATVIQNTGLLTGTGGTAGVIVNDGGTISPGTGASTADLVGTLTTGGQTWNDGGIYAFKINDTAGSLASATQTANAGQNWDRLVMASLTVNSTATPFVIDVVPLASGLQFDPGAKFELANIKAATSLTPQQLAAWFDINTGALGLSDSNFTLTTAASTAAEGTGGTDIFLTFNGPSSVQATPEPAVMGLLALGGTMLLRRRRQGTV